MQLLFKLAAMAAGHMRINQGTVFEEIENVFGWKQSSDGKQSEQRSRKTSSRVEESVQGTLPENSYSIDFAYHDGNLWLLSTAMLVSEIFGMLTEKNGGASM